MKKRVLGLIILVLAVVTFSTFHCTKLDINPDAQGIATGATLTAVSSFGTNPGALNMYYYAPSSPVSPAALVVAMHGCTQTANEYADRTQWNALANKYGFYVVYPEQISGNNSSKCFNWFEPGDIVRGQGEALSIKQMVDKMKSMFSIDSSKVFVTGLSAGGAMTPVMMATYPDVFAGGAVMAGIPYKCATSMSNAFSCMSPGVDKTPADWGNLVRGAYSGYTGSYPTLMVFQGASDYTVKDLNMTELVDQWTNVHGLSQTPSSTATFRTSTKKTYGTKVVTYHITGMGHAISVDPGTNADQGGTTGAYSEDKDIYSSYYAAQFWGLIGGTTPPPVEIPVVSISPNGGTFSSAQSVTISATNSPTSIQYSFNNSTWTNYTGAFTVSSSTTVYAKATNSAGTGTKQAAFTINTSTVSVPVVSISPNGGTFSSAQSVTISATNSPTSIQYSFNNSTWTNYSSAISVSSSTTVYAKATNSAGTGTAQATFTINTSTSTTVSFSSISADDGYVKALSTGYSPSVGTYTTMAIGRGSDALYNRAFLSFDTSSIPDGATITRAYVVITYSSISGDPWASSNTMVVDVKNGIFGTYSTTQTTDWAAAATANAVASIAKFTSGTKQSTDFNSSGLSAINKTGKTQLKLRFANDQTSTAYIFIQEGASCKLYVTYN